VKLSASQWTSIGLAIVAVGSVAVVLATRSEPGTTERSERERNLIRIWREDEIQSVSFSEGKQSFRVERAAGAASSEKKSDFVLVANGREPADAASVDRVISGFGFATPVRRLDDGNLAELGIATPEASVDIAMGESLVRLALGKNAPSPPGSVYVSVTERNEEPRLAVVSKEVAALFRTTPDDLRVRALAGVARSDIRALVLEYPNDKVLLERSSAGFRVSGKGRANRARLDDLFGALARLEAKRFVEVAEVKRARREPPSVVVRVTPVAAKARPVVVSVGGACPGFGDEVLALVEGPPERAACVERAVARALELERAALLDKAPFSARPDEVETLRIERGGKRLVLTRRGAAFLLREPSEATVELDAGNARLAALLDASAELVENPDPKKLGLEPPDGRVVVTRIAENDKAVEETLELGKTQPDGTLPVRRTDDGAVLTLGRDAARAFAVDAALLRSLRLADFALSALSELVLSAPERQVLRRAPNGFELVTPPGYLHDGALSTDAVLAFGSLTALRFVADADDGSFGLGTPTLTALAKFDADGGARSVELVVGRATPGGFFAKLASDPSVFVVERSVAERLGSLLVDRAAFLAEPKILARVVITKNGVTRTLERVHDELAPAAGSGIDPAVATRLIEALGGLRAEAAVHTGAARPEEGFQKPSLEVRYEPLPGLGKTRSFVIGASGRALGPVPPANEQASHFARAAGIEATFVIADAKLKPLFDLF
jgi:hypothetical protein